MKNLSSILVLLLPVISLCQSYIVTEYEPKTDSLLTYFDTDTSCSNYYFGIPTCEIKCDDTILVSSISPILPKKSPCKQKEKIIGRNCFKGDTIIYGFNQYSGKLEGYYVIQYPSGRMWIRYTYHKDKLVGIVEHFYDSFTKKPKIKGTPSCLMALVETDEEGRLRNIKAQYTLAGKKLKKGNFKDGDGIILFYRADGSLLRSVEMKNGSPDGKCAYYYPTGQVLVSGKFKDGKFISIWNEFSIEGKTLATTDYK
ncbi:MAG: hypothetical protein COA97_01755 [Flavobacteriales bacterium]|nr:MAG: hypothetical protein COA97_01755 [Flavobacteriales bacterium]